MFLTCNCNIDIQLNVKGCKNLKDSFKRYVDQETMDGENKYMAEGHGLQDACKGVSFESFPPVLHLQLKRFEYDMQRDTMVKVHISLNPNRMLFLDYRQKKIDQRSSCISRSN